MDMYVYIAQQDKMHDFAFEVDSAVRCKLETHVLNARDGLAPFEWKKV